jgi:hypothetical protein
MQSASAIQARKLRRANIYSQDRESVLATHSFFSLAQRKQVVTGFVSRLGMFSTVQLKSELLKMSFFRLSSLGG